MSVQTLVDILTSSALRHPDREAYKFDKISLTFAELDRKTTQLANVLLKKNVKQGDKVAIYLPRSIESVIAVYGILKAGAVFVPVDPFAPASRVQFLLQDCAIELLITSKSQTKKLKNLLSKGIQLSTVVGSEVDSKVDCVTWGTVYQSGLSSALFPEINADDLAYIMYTSGSTGAPKGIMHTHQSGLHYAKLSAALYEVTAEDRVASHAPLHFDISTFSYFTAPLAGAATIIIPEAFTKLPASLSNLMEQEKITIWYSVPLALIQLLSHGLLEERDLSCLRWVLFGGEVFAPRHLRALMKLWKGATFCNVYGPAEINQCTYYHIKELPVEDVQIPLGKIWSHAKYRILDNRDMQVAPGQTGELVVHTKSMMRGYWNNPQLTQKSIIDLGVNGSEELYYRTGDLVVETEQGNLVFQGRNDRQIKVRGYRVELDEVEAVLYRHQQVAEAATFTVTNSSNEIQIGAAVTLASGSVIDPEELKSFCHFYLPTYAVPKHIEIVTKFPRTSSGKINRKLLSKNSSNKNE